MDIPLDLKLFMNNSGPKIYKCEECNASYSDKSYFDLHKQTHDKTVEGGPVEASQEEIPTVQIVMPAQQGTDQEVIQDQQLSALKRAYGGDVHQIYELAPTSRYQVVTSGTPHVLTAVTLASLPVQVCGGVTGHVSSLPAYTTPTYVLTEQPITAAQPHSQGTQRNITPTTTTASVPLTIHSEQPVTVQQQVQQPVVVSQPQQTPQTQQSATQRLVIALDPKDRPYKCDQCTASFIDPAEFNDHKKKHSGDGPFTCEDCHFTFMYKSHFRSHKTRCVKKRAMMPNPPKPILNPAPIKRQFPTNTTPRKAQVVSQPITQQQQVITQTVQQQQQQPQQQQTTTSTRTTRATQSKQTPANAFNPSNPTFKRQKKEQRVDRPFECTDCDASFQSVQDLQTHKAKHTGEGPFKCEECRFVFLYRKLYDAHRRRCEKKRKELGIAAPPTSTPQPQPQPQTQQIVQQIPQQRTIAQPATVQLSGPIQIHAAAVQGHPQTTVIDMRQIQGQGQAQGQVQHLPHPTLIEQVIHVTPVPTTLPGGRQELKYDIVQNPVEVTDVNQIMNLIKVKGHHQ